MRILSFFAALLFSGQAFSLDAEIIRSTINQHGANLNKIFERHLAIDPLIGGCATYRLRIVGNGSIEKADVTSSEISAPKMLKEVSTYIVNNISFPAGPQQTLEEENYTFCFSAIDEKGKAIPKPVPSQENEAWLKNMLEEETKRRAAK